MTPKAAIAIALAQESEDFRVRRNTGAVIDLKDDMEWWTSPAHLAAVTLGALAEAGFVVVAKAALTTLGEAPE